MIREELKTLQVPSAKRQQAPPHNSSGFGEKQFCGQKSSMYAHVRTHVGTLTF